MASSATPSPKVNESPKKKHELVAPSTFLTGSDSAAVFIDRVSYSVDYRIALFFCGIYLRTRSGFVTQQEVIPKKILGVELHFENSDRSVNLKLLEHFKQKREELERKMGEELTFEKWGKTNSRIYIRRFVGMLEDAIKNKTMIDWATETMIRLYEVFKPELDRIVPTIR